MELLAEPALRVVGVASLDTSWCALGAGPEIESLVRQLRAGEAALAAAPGFAASARGLVRMLVTKDVDAARELAADARVSDTELRERCFAMRGQPWDQARARADMRERIRIWQRLERGTCALPATLDELFALWSEAVAGEVAVYRESMRPQLRRGIPFAHGDTPFEEGTLPPGKETVAPEDVEPETRRWLASLAVAELPLEAHALVSLFVFELIHPFRDGNGRTGRMLLCDMLSARYSLATLLAFVAKLQENRAIISQTTAEIVCERADLSPFVELYLGLALEAQRDLRDWMGL